MIEMSLKNFRTMHEPRSTNAAIGQTPTLNLPPLPQIHQTNAEATPALPAVSRSRERRSNTVISQVQGAFNLKMEDMATGGINREKFKSLIDSHLKRQKGQYNQPIWTMLSTHCWSSDYETFSNRILDEVFRDKSLLSWDELDAAISHYQLDKVAMTEQPSVWHYSRFKIISLPHIFSPNYRNLPEELGCGQRVMPGAFSSSSGTITATYSGHLCFHSY